MDQCKTLSNKTILYVEDNPDNRLLVKRLLTFAHCTMIEAENAHQAREIVKSTVPDLILMDINMPDVDGYTLTQEFKSQPTLTQVPIIAITANVMKGDREKTVNAGCDGYIDKPINVDSFLEDLLRYV